MKTASKLRSWVTAGPAGLPSVLLDCPMPRCMLSMSRSFPATLSTLHCTIKLCRHPVGIYPEVKHPSWHDSRALSCMANTTITEKVMEVRSCCINAPSTPNPGPRIRPQMCQ